MPPRTTPWTLTAAVALAATLGLAASALACDGQAKSASAAPACCAAKSKVTACCAKPATKVAVQPQNSTVFVPLAHATPAAAPAPFSSLPNFARPEPIVAGLMAFLDPETGLLTGPIGELRVPDDLARALAAPVELTPVTLPNGSVMVDLQGTMQDYYVLHIDALGHRTIQCVPSVLQAKTPPPVMPTAKPLTVAPVTER